MAAVPTGQPKELASLADAPKYSTELTNKGLQRVQGMNVWRDIGGNLFGPSSLRPTQGGPRSLLYRRELNQKDFNPKLMAQRVRDGASSIRKKPLDTLMNRFTDPLSQGPELFQSLLDKTEEKLGYQKTWNSPKLQTQFGPQHHSSIQHKLGNMGTAKHSLTAKLGGEGSASGKLHAGRAGVKAEGQADFRAGPVVQHRSEADLGALGKGSLTNTIRSDLQAHGSGMLKAGVAGLRGIGGAGFRVGPAVESNGTWKHDLGELGFGGRAALEAKGDVKGDVSLDARGLQVALDGNASVGGEVAGGVKAKTDLFEVAAGAKGEAKAHAAGHLDGAIDISGIGLDAGGKVGVTAAVEGHVGGKTAGVKLGGEDLNLNAGVKGRAEATAQAGARANAALTYKPPRAGVEIGGKAFAGVKAEVEGQVGIGDMIKLKGKAGAWAGAGAEGKIELGFDDGKLRFGISGGAAIGYGTGLGGVVEIDVKKIANAAIGTGLDVVEKGIKYAANPIEAVKDAKKLIEKVPDKIEKTVTSVAKTGEAVVKAATSGLKSLADKLFG